MDFKNPLSSQDIPMGLSMAMAENLDALREFSSFSPQQQQEVIEKTHGIQSKQEMHQFVSDHFRISDTI